jgi:hypothetical protein
MGLDPMAGEGGLGSPLELRALGGAEVQVLEEVVQVDETLRALLQRNR